jgi:hypothetical protein
MEYIVIGIVTVLIILTILFLIGRAAIKREEQKKIEDEIRLKRLVGKYGHEQGNKLFLGEISQGMSEEMVIDALGKPVDIDEKVLKSKSKRTLKYNQINSRSFGTKIFTENGIVVGYEIK